MKCPYCGQEAEKGNVSCMTLQGFSQIMLTYTSDEEAGKKFLKRKTHDKMIMPGEKIEAFYCSCCKKIMPGFEIE